MPKPKDKPVLTPRPSKTKIEARYETNNWILNNKYK
jgi:hypothetical protein